MKKILASLVTISIVALSAQAVQVTWSSPQLYFPVLTETLTENIGDFTGNRLNATVGSPYNGASYYAEVIFYLVDPDDSSLSLFEVAENTTKTGTSALGVLNNKTSDEFQKGSTYLAVITITSPNYTVTDIDGISVQGYFTISGSKQFYLEPLLIGDGNVGGFTVGFPTEWTFVPVPEPATMALLGIGVVTLGLRRRRK